MVENLYLIMCVVYLSQVDERTKGVTETREADEDITAPVTGSESKRSRHDSSMSLDSGDDQNKNRSRSSSQSSVASISDKSRQMKNVKESLQEIEHQDKVTGTLLQSTEMLSSGQALETTASPAHSDSDRSEKSMSISPARSESANSDSEAKGDTLPELKSGQSAIAPDVHSRSSSESKKLSPVASLKQQSSPERNSESRSPSSTPTGKRSKSATRDRSGSSSASSRKASPERRKSASSSSSSSSSGSRVSRKSSQASESALLPNDEKESVEESKEAKETSGDLPADDISREPESADLHSIPLPVAPLPASTAMLSARSETPVQAVPRRSPSPPRKNSKSTSRSPARRSASKSSVRRNTSRLRSRSRSRSARRFRLVFVMEIAYSKLYMYCL